MREPLVAPLAAIATGIMLSRYAAFGKTELIAAIAAFLLLAVLARRAGTRAAAVCALLLALCCAGSLTDVAHRPAPPPELDADGPVILAGCVVEPPALSGGRERFLLELEPGARAQVTLYAGEDARLPALHYGQNVELDATVRRPRNFLNPGAFDYVHYLARRDIYWTASARGDTGVRVLPGTCGSSFGRAVVGLRTTALERIERLYAGRPYETAMMQAILIGETYALERAWTENFRSTGTFHALVISGTHVAVLAAFLLFLLRLCFVPRGWAALITTLGAWLYALVTGWQPPCVRSAAGFTLFMAGAHFYRRQSGVNLLAAVAIAFLALDPEQMFEASFQLSFLAVAFIVLFAVPLLERTTAPLARGLHGLMDAGRDPHLEPRTAQFRVEMRLFIETVRLWTHLPVRLIAALTALAARFVFYAFGLAVVSAAVQIGLMLPMVVYFHRLGLSGLSANLLVVPLMELVVPAGFVAIFTGWGWAAWVAAAALHASESVVNWHARLEPAWRVPTPPLWLGAAVAAALIGAAFANRAARRWRILAALPLIVLLFLLLRHPFRPEITPRQFEVSAIDVGQGDSLLLAFPDGKAVVMDGGGILTFGRGRRPRLEIGEDVVAPYLWKRGIRRLDALVLTHTHEDHAGGLPALLENFPVKELWAAAAPDVPAWRKIRASAERHGVRMVRLARGQAFDFGGTRVEVMAPAAGYEPGGNAVDVDSLALRVRYGRRAFLFTGDMDPGVEAELAGTDCRADVLKVAHHGSRRSTTEEFLESVHPAFALISAGAGNSYGHPHPDTLARLAGHNVEVLRTDHHGLVTVRTDGQRLDVDTAAWSGTQGMINRPF